MSDLSKFNSRIVLLRAAWDRIITLAEQQYENFQCDPRIGYSSISIEVSNMITEADKDMDDLAISLKKMLDKVDSLDPVTGAARYGPTTVSKIFSLRDSFAEIQNIRESIMERVHTLNTIYHQSYKIERNGGDTKQEPLQQQEQLGQQLQATEIMESKMDIDWVQLQKDQEEEDLALKANAAKERRRLALHARRDKTEEEHRAVQRWMDELNSPPRGVGALRDVLHSMREVDPSQAQSACSLLLKILTNIQSHPDDFALRTLKLTNQKLHDLLTGPHVCGGKGLQAVIACGFRALFDKREGEDEGAREGGEGEARVPVGVVLKMEEPNPETEGGTARWLAWFDSLTACVEELSLAVQKER